MGVKDLLSFIKKKNPTAIEEIAYDEFRNKVLVVDVSPLLYKFCFTSKKTSPHLDGIFRFLSFILQKGVIPIMVFDGPPPPEKLETIKKRKKTKTINITKEMCQEVKELCKEMNVKVIQSPSEADALCCYLSKKLSNCMGVLSNDSDTLLYEANLIFDFDFRKDSLRVIKIENLLKVLELDYEAFRDFCILLGTDYSERIIPGCGPVNTLKKVRESMDGDIVTIKLDKEQKANYDKVLKTIENQYNICESHGLDIENNDSFNEVKTKYDVEKLYKIMEKSKYQRKTVELAVAKLKAI